MGTRNLTMVISNGETKVAQYGQWDGYPEGQGVVALNFLSNTDLKEFKQKMNSVKFINGTKEKEINKWLKSIGVENGWMNMEQSKLYQEKYPLLTRDNGAGILSMIMESEEETNWVNDNREFAADSLFCEWAYVIDLDKNIFEVYEGFNTNPLTIEDRFYSLTSLKDNDYYPIKLSKSYDLNNLPLEFEFINDFKQEENA
jgi:hypothetical protein